MLFLVGAVYILGIIVTIVLLRKKSLFAIPVILGLIGLDMILGSSSLHSQLSNHTLEYSGIGYVALSVFLFLMMIAI
ncbi:hypothetical protein [Peribacillus alkalitolerans]|uniref:hypothetical protein n=1 Tax=Peribacillus alkalitolerans TaxID=1550385 RepID=UPI0013CF764F|nr:hypothetical protein [Peribacillus alkalitolerans]